MEWPLKDETTGKFRTTPTNQSIWLAAAAAASDDTTRATAFLHRVENCKNWRKEYTGIVEEFTRLMASESSESAVKMCQAGLDAAQKALVFRVDDETTVTLEEAMARDWERLESKTYTGKHQQAVAAQTPFQLASPHGTDSNPLFLTGDQAAKQIKAWSDYGCMEPSAAEHATAVCKLADVSSLVSNKTFCLLGLTSEMGPAYSLLGIPGAHVMGVARSEKKMSKLVEWLEAKGAATTKLETLQADMLKQAPQIAQWIVETAPAGRELVILPLAYMDGEACPRVTVAMEAVVTHVMKHRANVGLCYLVSPAIVMAIPEDAARNAKERYEKEGFWKRCLSTATFNNWYQPANTWKDLDADTPSLAILNGLVNFQGPNYALAKTIQTWRCIVSHATAGIKIAAPPAPGTRTYSVQHSPEAAAFLEGMQYVEPFVAFDVWCCSSLLTAIALHQLDQPVGSRPQLQHPLTLFWDGCVHGGSWRCPYSTESFMAMSYILGKTVAKSGWCPEGALAPKPETTTAATSV